MSKVLEVRSESLVFEGGLVLKSEHESDCREHHYVSFGDLTIVDFIGLEFDLSSPAFIEKVDGYGVALHPVHGHPVRVPGYGFNDGYYSDELKLELRNGGAIVWSLDVSECQVIDVD